MPRTHGPMNRVVLVAALAGAAATGALLAGQPLTMRQGFEKALSSSREEFSFNTASRVADNNRPGDEGYWLTRAEMKSPPLFDKPMIVGDRITIAGADGMERKLEVVDVKAIGARQANSAGLVLITCRINSDAATPSETLVRFIVEGQATPPTHPQKTAAVPKSL